MHHLDYARCGRQCAEQVVTPGHFVTTLSRCRVSGGALAGNDEGLDWAWFAPDALPDDLTVYARGRLTDALSDARMVVR